MNRLRLHIPAYVDVREGDTFPKNEFEGLEGLMNLPVIKRFTDKGYRLEITERNSLMAVSPDRLTSHYIGKIEDMAGLNFPEWTWAFEVVFEDGHTEIRSDVNSVCGNVVTMKDGRKLKCLHR